MTSLTTPARQHVPGNGDQANHNVHWRSGEALLNVAQLADRALRSMDLLSGFYPACGECTDATNQMGRTKPCVNAARHTSGFLGMARRGFRV